MSEPTQWVKTAVAEIARNKPIEYPAIVQMAIDCATASKLDEIKELKSSVSGLTYNLVRRDKDLERLSGALSKAVEDVCAKEEEIKKLSAKLDMIERGMGTINEAAGTMLAENKRAKDLLGCALIDKGLDEKRIAQMAHLLERMPHVPDETRAGDSLPGQEPCHFNCPRCAWEALKKEKT